MSRPGVLRGRAFREALFTGKRLHGKFVRAAYIVADGPGEPARIGISVPKRIGNAVRRNRIRRLIREAVRIQADTHLLLFQESGSRIDILLSFSSSMDGPPNRLSLKDFLPDIQKVFSTIADRTIHRP